MSLRYDKSEIRYTYTNVNKTLEKLSNKKLALLFSSYCPLAIVFYGRVGIILNIIILHLRHLTRFLVRVCLFKMNSRKLVIPTLVSIITSKICLTSACQCGCCLFLWMFYGIRYNLVNKWMNMHFNQPIKIRDFPCRANWLSKKE